MGDGVSRSERDVQPPTAGLVDVARLLKEYGAIVSDNGNVGSKVDAFFETYPVYKKSLLERMTGNGKQVLRGFYTDARYDADFYKALLTAIEDTAGQISDKHDISNVWYPLRILSGWDQDMALSIANRLIARAEAGQLPSDDALRLARVSMEYAIGKDFLGRAGDEDLLKLLDDPNLHERAGEAYRELLTRNNQKALDMGRLSVEALAQPGVNYMLLREIFAQKLLEGDFQSWKDGLENPDETFSKQAHFSIYYAAKRGAVDVSDPIFLNALRGFSDADYFEAIRSVVGNGKDLIPELVDGVVERLMSNIRDIGSIEAKEGLLFTEPAIDYLCRTDPVRGRKLMDETLPAVRDFLTKHPTTWLPGIFCESTLLGFAPLIAEDMSILDKYYGTDDGLEKTMLEARHTIFWRLISLSPERAEEFIQKYYDGSYIARLNGYQGLISILGTHVSEEEQQKILSHPGVRQFFTDIALNHMLDGEGHANRFIAKILREKDLPGLAELVGGRLDAMGCPEEEMLFINYNLPEIASGEMETVQGRLEAFRRYKAECHDANLTKAPRYIFSKEQEEKFWADSQTGVAILLETCPDLLEKMVEEANESPSGYYRLRDDMKLYSKIAYATGSRSLVDAIYNVAKGMAPGKLWDFLSKNFSVEEMTKLDEDAILEMKDFLDAMGNLNLNRFFGAYLKLGRGVLTADAIKMGIDETGKAGQNRLRNAAYAVIGQMLSQPGYRADESNPLELEILREISRFDVSEWKKGGDLIGMVKRVNASSDMARNDLPSGFSPREVRVKRSDYDDSAFEYTAECISSYRSFQEALAYCLSNLRTEQGFVSEMRGWLLSTLEAKREVLNNVLARRPEISQKVERQLRQAETLGQQAKEIDSTHSLIQRIASMRNYGGYAPWESWLRRAVVFDYLKSDDGAIGGAFEMSQAAPGYESIARVNEFAFNTIKEVFAKRYSGDRAVSRAISEAFDLKALAQDLDRYKSFQEYGRTEHLLFVPNRGIMGELSGYICDACWTYQTDVMENNPNITPVIIVTGREPRYMRAGGAFLMLEAEDADAGDKVMVVRGNNPLENLIGRLDVDDYVMQSISYTKEMGALAGISKVAVPLGSRGTATTNRESISRAYYRLFLNNPRVRLQGDIQFNGYDLSSICVLV